MSTDHSTDDVKSHPAPAGSGAEVDDTESRTDRLDTAIQKLVEARGTDVGEVSARFSEEMILTAPNSFSKHTSGLRALEISGSGVLGDMAWIEVPSGRRFFSPVSRNNHQRAFEYVSDLISPNLTAETFLAALDVVGRYASGQASIPPSLYPPKNGSVMECGAYLGHKTIRFAEDLVPEGEILAVELMPENCRIFRRNIEENGLQDRVSLIEAGVWSGPDRLKIWGKGRQRNSLFPLEKIKVESDVWASVDSIDHHLDAWGRPSIDLLYITVNAAEIEALQGLDRWRDRIRAVVIEALYEREGRDCGDWCRELLIEMGFELVSGGGPKQVCAINPDFPSGSQ